MSYEACLGPGFTALRKEREGELRAAVVDASAEVQVLNSIQQRGHKSGRASGLLGRKGGVFIGFALGFHWVKYINLATLHIPHLPEGGGGV